MPPCVRIPDNIYYIIAYKKCYNIICCYIFSIYTLLISTSVTVKISVLCTSVFSRIDLYKDADAKQARLSFSCGMFSFLGLSCFARFAVLRPNNYAYIQYCCYHHQIIQPQYLYVYFYAFL